MHLTATLQLHDLSPSIGSVVDAYDNTLAETTVGLYKTECIRDESPFRRGPLTALSDLEATTADLVHWYNTSRLMHRLGRQPPDETEAHYYAQTRDDQTVGHITEGAPNPGRFRRQSAGHRRISIALAYSRLISSYWRQAIGWGGIFRGLGGGKAMEPISAVVVTSLLVTYGRHLAGVAGGVLDEAIADRLRALWVRVTNRFSRDEQASGALSRLAMQPDNPRRQAAVEDHLDEMMQADPAFASALAELARQASSDTYANIDIRDVGSVAIGGNVTMTAEGHVAGRDLTVNESPARKSRGE